MALQTMVERHEHRTEQSQRMYKPSNLLLDGMSHFFSAAFGTIIRCIGTLKGNSVHIPLWVTDLKQIYRLITSTYFRRIEGDLSAASVAVCPSDCRGLEKVW